VNNLENRKTYYNTEGKEQQNRKKGRIVTIYNVFFPRQGICYGLTVYFKDYTDQSLPPVITITEDNSIPPEEGSDVLAYFGIKNPGQMIE
jgi:hypothetical protein